MPVHVWFAAGDQYFALIKYPKVITRNFHFRSYNGESMSSNNHSNIQPARATVTEVCTISSPDGERTESKTYRYGGTTRNNGYPSAQALQETVYFDRTKRYSKGWGRSIRSNKPHLGVSLEIKGKNFEEVRTRCLREGRLFEDGDFPATDSSLTFQGKPRRVIEWKRPHVSVTKFFCC